jgi:cytochrome c-type biogenesis protein CcmH
MTAFAFAAAALVAVALAWVVVPLMRRAPREDVQREASNLAIIRDQLKELDADLAAGVLAPDQHREARAELERRALEEGRTDATHAAASSLGGARTAVALAVVIPVAAALLYLQLGAKEAFSPEAMAPAPEGGEHSVTAEQVEQMLAKLTAKLKQEPNDPKGWSILARSLYVMQRFPEAAEAYAKLAELVPNDPEVLADYADTLAMAQGRTLAGKPMELIERALKLDPNNWKALAMAGTAAYDRKDYRAAVGYWEKVRATLPAESPLAQAMDSSIAEARELGGMKPAPAGAAAAAAAPAPAPKGPVAAAGGGQVTGTVTLSGALAGKTDPNDTLFIFARAAEGPRMPLAILRLQVKDLPAKFALDDSMAMSPAMKLSGFSDVVVGARISKSATATPQSGDLEGLSSPVKVGSTGITIVIDRTVP